MCLFLHSKNFPFQVPICFYRIKQQTNTFITMQIYMLLHLTEIQQKLECYIASWTFLHKMTIFCHLSQYKRSIHSGEVCISI